MHHILQFFMRSFVLTLGILLLSKALFAQIINQVIQPDEFCVSQKSVLKKKYVKQLDVYTTEDMRKETLTETYTFEKGIINGYKNAQHNNYAVYVRTAYGSRYIDSIVCPTEARIKILYSGPKITVTHFVFDTVSKSFQSQPTVYDIKTNEFSKITAVNASQLAGKKKTKLYAMAYKYEGATILRSFSGTVAGQKAKVKGTVESDYSGKVQKVISPDKQVVYKYTKDGLISQKVVTAKDSEPITYYFKYTFE